MADFTVLVLGFDRSNLCVVVEPVYVAAASDQRDAGRLAAEGYKEQTGIPVQSLYAVAGTFGP